MKKPVSFRKVALYLLYLIGVLALDLKINYGYSAEVTCMRRFSSNATHYFEIGQEKIPTRNDALSNRFFSFSLHFRSSFSNPFVFQPACFSTYTYFSFSSLDLSQYKSFLSHLIQYSAFSKRYINYCKLNL